MSESPLPSPKRPPQEKENGYQPGSRRDGYQPKIVIQPKFGYQPPSEQSNPSTPPNVGTSAQDE